MADVAYDAGWGGEGSDQWLQPALWHLASRSGPFHRRTKVPTTRSTWTFAGIEAVCRGWPASSHAGHRAMEMLEASRRSSREAVCGVLSLTLMQAHRSPSLLLTTPCPLRQRREEVRLVLLEEVIVVIAVVLIHSGLQRRPLTHSRVCKCKRRSVLAIELVNCARSESIELKPETICEREQETRTMS